MARASREVSGLNGRFVVLIGEVARGRDVRLPSRAKLGRRRGWSPAAWVDDSAVADTIVGLLRAEAPDSDVQVVAYAKLAVAVGSEQADAVREVIRNPTLAERERARDLEHRAGTRLYGKRWRRVSPGPARLTAPTGRSGLHDAEMQHVAERRSGLDRRSGNDRRGASVRDPDTDVLPFADRRRGERRSGVDRRAA